MTFKVDGADHGADGSTTVPESPFTKKYSAAIGAAAVTTLLDSGLFEYLRFSSELQSTDSNVNQQHRCDLYLASTDLAHMKPTVLADDEVSGTLLDRPAYNELMTLVADGKVKVLIVAELSRLGRADMAMYTIKNIIAKGGRFISAREGIDTDRPGWQNQVRTADAQHSSSSEYTAARVRDGQAGRIRDGNGSAGDTPLGYCTKYRESDSTRVNSKSRVHRKDVFIEPDGADAVRKVFGLKKLRYGNAAIAKHAIENGFPLPRKCKGGWTAALVRRILTNPKYRGEWAWGKTITVRDGNGKKIHRPAKPQEIVRVQRPDLRIVSDEVFDAVQAILAEDLATFGNKPGGKKRGPNGNFRIKRAGFVTLGLIRCSECGSVLQASGSSKDVKRLGCPMHAVGKCSRVVRVVVGAAETMVTAGIGALLLAEPTWLPLLMGSLNVEVTKAAAALPRERDKLEADIQDVIRKVDRYSDLVLTNDSAALLTKLKLAETRQRDLEARLRALPPASEIRVPEKAWVMAELANLSSLLKSHAPDAIAVIRQTIGRIDADPVIAPGKKRGYCRLSFSLNLPGLVDIVLRRKLPRGISAMLAAPTDADANCVRMSVDLRAPLKTEKFAHDIWNWRHEQPPVPWSEIARRTELTMANCMIVYKRFGDGPHPAA